MRLPGGVFLKATPWPEAALPLVRELLARRYADYHGLPWGDVWAPN